MCLFISKLYIAAASIAALALAGCGRSVPVPEATPDAAAVERAARAYVEAMKPRRPGKPLIAVLAHNEATETTDFLLSHAVLERSGVAEVQAVAPRRGRVKLYPTLEVEVQQDLAGFDKAHPRGADYVIVPAMDDVDDPAIGAWLREQAAKGARIVSVCAGALIVGRAGLLDGRRFTTHWYFRKDVLERHPGAVYVPHQRYVADRGVGTSTGITATVPTMLALVEAIGGRERARALAAELGVESWTPAHDSNAFGLSFGRAARYALTKAAFWQHEEWVIDVREGMDDIALAFAADSWSRTGRIRVRAAAPGPVTLRSGLVLLAQPAPAETPRVPLTPALKPVRQLERTLCEIEERFGDWAAVELEFPRDADACVSRA